MGKRNILDRLIATGIVVLVATSCIYAADRAMKYPTGTEVKSLTVDNLTVGGTGVSQFQAINSTGNITTDTNFVGNGSVLSNMTLSQFKNQTAWRVFYSNSTGAIIELALGASGEYLKSNGATSAPSFSVPAGGAHDALTLAADAETILSLSTQELGLDTQTANYVFAGPTSGAAADPTFRALVSGDIPDLSSVYQPLDTDLTTWAGVTPSANGQSLVAAANYAAMRTLLDLEPGTDFYNISDSDSKYLNMTNANAGTLAVARGGTGAANFDNLIALTSNTTGNYVASVATTAPLSGGAAGSEGAALTLSIPKAAAGTDGYLNGTDFTTFNNKVATTRYINTTAPLSGGGDLSADRTLSMTKEFGFGVWDTSLGDAVIPAKTYGVDCTLTKAVFLTNATGSNVNITVYKGGAYNSITTGGGVALFTMASWTNGTGCSYNNTTSFTNATIEADRPLILHYNSGTNTTISGWLRY